MRACSHCPEMENESGASFCIGCGRRLEGTESLEPVRCDACGEAKNESGAPFCIGCGRQLAAPADRKPRRRVLWKVAAAAALVLIVSWVVLGLIPEKARLIVQAYDLKRWTITAERQGETISLTAADVILPAGTYEIHALVKLGAADGSESVTLTLRPGCVHVYAVGSVPLELDARTGPVEASMPRGVPGTGALWIDPRTERLRSDRFNPKTSEPLPMDAEITVNVRDGALGADAGTWVLVSNPYNEVIQFTVAGEETVWNFTLAGPALRLVPSSPGTRLTVTARIGIAGDLLDEETVTVPKGPSLYTVGGATCYVWDSGKKNELQFQNESERILAGHIAPLKNGSEYLYRFPIPSPVSMEQTTLLIRESYDRRPDAHLLIAVAAPLLPPFPEALGKLTAHPDVRVTELPAPEALRAFVIQAAAVVGDGIVVIADQAAYDYATGQRLHGDGPPLRDVAAAGDGLFLITRQARSATIEGRDLVVGMSLMDPTIRLWSQANSERVYLYGGKASGGLCVVDSYGIERIMDPDIRVTAVGATKNGLLIGRWRRIEKLTFDDWIPESAPIIELPAGPAAVIGLYDAGGVLVFATEVAIYYMPSAGMVVPLVIGIGGPIYPYRDGILVHDHKSRKLLRVTGSILERK